MKHNRTKVTLSANELELVTNAEILLTKNEIIKKVYTLFGNMAEEYVNAANILQPLPELEIPPKISRGENYRGLPYVMLDYPRHFKKNETFAIRTFFWWGNFFSITLQLSGRFKDAFAPVLEKSIAEEKFENWFVGVSEDPWQHHFENDNYQQLFTSTVLPKVEFLKLAKKIPLTEWDRIESFLIENFLHLVQTIKT